MIQWVNYLVICCFCLLGSVAAQNVKKELLPEVPAGYDAFRMWQLLPQQRIGVRAYMRSTYDRGGGSADASNFLFMKKEDENVTLDVKGNGVLYFFRANHWHGSPWHFIVDGKDNSVSETATADPVDAVKKYTSTAFIPGKALPPPLAWTWGSTKGADLIWVPMRFKDSVQIAYSRTFYGTGYYIYHLYANPEALSCSPESWNSNQLPDRDVTDLINRAGTDIAPKHIKKRSGTVQLDKQTVKIAQIRSALSVVRAVKLTLPLDQAEVLERARLRITWDDRPYASVDAPLCLFFGAGTFFNRDKKEYLVKGLPVNVRYDYAQNKITLACYYPMPFFQSAQFELTDIPANAAKISYEIRYENKPGLLPGSSSYFHATYQDFPKPAYGQDLVWLDTKGIEGQQDWSGSFMGTSFIFSHNAELHTLEGDPRFFFDDSQTPQAYGTGTEEWAGGGDYWGGENMTLPFAGHPCGATERKTAVNKKDLIQSAYRFLWADLMPFGKRAVIRFEHSENVSEEHYESVCYWYGLPAPSLIKTDSLDIGNTTDEQVHQYRSPRASAVQSVTSRYEWGPDTYPAHAWGYDLSKRADYRELIGKEIYPAQTKDGRITNGISEFTVHIRKDNRGVLLRRTLDYSYPNQTAEVFVAPVPDDKNLKEPDWKRAGTWYLAGANTWVDSRPKEELGARKYVVKTSDRRFRDDEFLIPAALTKDCSAIRIRIRFIPDHKELYPGTPFPNKSAWSEMDYQVYSYILPHFALNKK
ncbi:hypothetical protein A8C56_13460 [Niabella ginsenosidivorans]|uniref:DUF2961 domain-containing protein n=1 Tax=Niabella ginsenosidivorans TaxID=1176587 RepID=A0A1A9I581_9BACT|nr:DUF2961 domain-containing protein [Niabella ginsenosidivorans]ANH81850.1 hypothetical protein A8C56_13460 [Niabella ginsenosidivorans]